MRTETPGGADHPVCGPLLLLTHRPLEPPDPAVTVLSGDIGEAVAAALDAAGGKDLEVIGADAARPVPPAGPREDALGAISSARSGDATILRFRVRTRSDPSV